MSITYTYTSKCDNDKCKFLFTGDDDDEAELDVTFDENGYNITMIGQIKMEDFPNVLKPTKPHFRAQDIKLSYIKQLGANQQISNVSFDYNPKLFKLPPLKRSPAKVKQARVQQVRTPQPQQTRMQQVRTPQSHERVQTQAQVSMHKPEPIFKSNAAKQRYEYLTTIKQRIPANLATPSNSGTLENIYRRFCFNKENSRTYDCYYIPLSIQLDALGNMSSYQDLCNLMGENPFYKLMEVNSAKNSNRLSGVYKYIKGKEYANSCGYVYQSVSVQALDPAVKSSNKEFKTFVEQALYMQVNDDNTVTFLSALPAAGGRGRRPKKITAKSKK